MRIARFYTRSLERRPLLTKMLTSSTLFSTSEVLKSRIEEYSTGKQRLSFRCICKAAILGGFFAAPSLHLWYTRALPKLAPLQSIRLTAKKVLLDQTVFAPYFCSLVLTYGYLSNGHSFADAKSRILRELPRCMQANWKFWPLVQLFNFCMIPFKFQILYINVVGVFWQGYLTHLRLNTWNI